MGRGKQGASEVLVRFYLLIVMVVTWRCSLGTIDGPIHLQLALTSVYMFYFLFFYMFYFNIKAY